jgi:hypothetical protein
MRTQENGLAPKDEKKVAKLIKNNKCLNIYEM